MEGVFEEDCQLRRCVEHELLSEPSSSPEQALKVDWQTHNSYTYFITFLPRQWAGSWLWVVWSTAGSWPWVLHVAGVNSVFVSEPEGAAEAEVAGSPISAAAAGVPLGVSGFRSRPLTTHSFLWSGRSSCSSSSDSLGLSTGKMHPQNITIPNQRNQEIIMCLYHVPVCVCGPPGSLQADVSGRRFFQASSQAALLRDLRQRIQVVSDFHHAASQALRVPPAAHTLIRQPGGRNPRQSPSPLPHLSSATHRAGQVGPSCLDYIQTFVCLQGFKSQLIGCL